MREAESFHRQSLTIRERALGHRHVMVGNSYNNLGLFCLAMGDLQSCETEFFAGAQDSISHLWA